MQPIELAKLFYKNGPFIVHLGGGVHWCWIARWESPQIQPYWEWEFLLHEDIVPLLWIISYTTSLNGVVQENGLICKYSVKWFESCV